MSCPSATAVWKRTAVDSHLIDTVTLRNPGAATIGAGGGTVKGTPSDTASVSALLQQGTLSGDVTLIAERLQLKNPAVWLFSYTQANLTNQTQIIYGTRTFNVRAVNKAGLTGVYQQAVCDEI